MLFAGGASNDDDSCCLPGGGCGGGGAADDGAFAQTHGVPRTPWGDPDLQGTFTNKDEVGTPFERPGEFEGRRIEDITPAEVAAILKKRHDDRPEAQAVASGRVGPIEWQSQVDLTKGSRLWFVTSPLDGKIPPLTAEARRVPQRVRRRNAGAVLRTRGSTSTSVLGALRRVCLVR